MKPQLMPPNLVEHFYLGGPSIAALRGGVDLVSDRQPEEWLAATVERADEPGVGLSHLVDGTTLREHVIADPVGWTGRADGLAGDVGILVKLIDAGQRLPVHVHPDREFAVAHLDCPYGKTEAWLVIATSGDNPSVWVGWNADLDADLLADRVEAQDSEWMLAHLNRLDVRAGDAVLVPAGTPHAVGAGVFVVEVQEPTDFSILLEWSVTSVGREDSHLGLGFPVVLPAVDHHALTAETLARLVTHIDLAAPEAEVVRALPAAADPFFRLDLVASTAGHGPTVEAGFAAVLALSGSGALRAGAEQVEVSAGQVYAVPAGFGDWTATGDLRLVVCRPGVPEGTP